MKVRPFYEFILPWMQGNNKLKLSSKTVPGAPDTALMCFFWGSIRNEEWKWKWGRNSRAIVQDLAFCDEMGMSKKTATDIRQTLQWAHRRLCITCSGHGKSLLLNYFITPRDTFLISCTFIEHEIGSTAFKIWMNIVFMTKQIFLESGRGSQRPGKLPCSSFLSSIFIW